jgi:hypothetical protein
MDVANSGAEVPMATMVVPITHSEIPTARARLAEDSIKVKFQANKGRPIVPVNKKRPSLGTMDFVVRRSRMMAASPRINPRLKIFDPTMSPAGNHLGLYLVLCSRLERGRYSGPLTNLTSSMV